MAAVWFQFRLRSLFLFWTLACMGAWAGRGVCFFQQAKFHHGQIQKLLQDRQELFLTGGSFSKERWRTVHAHFSLSRACEHAAFHPCFARCNAPTQVAKPKAAREYTVQVKEQPRLNQLLVSVSFAKTPTRSQLTKWHHEVRTDYRRDGWNLFVNYYKGPHVDGNVDNLIATDEGDGTLVIHPE